MEALGLQSMGCKRGRGCTEDFWGFFFRRCGSLGLNPHWGLLEGSRIQLMNGGRDVLAQKLPFCTGSAEGGGRESDGGSLALSPKSGG